MSSLILLILGVTLVMQDKFFKHILLCTSILTKCPEEYDPIKIETK